MRVCLCSTLFWVAHLLFISITNGADNEEAYKPRRWTTTGDGPYRMVVSSEAETLAQEESVSLAVSQEKKKKEKPSEEDLGEKYDKVTQRMILKRGRKRDRLPVDAINPRKRRRNPSPALVSTTGLPQTMSYNLYNHFRPLDQDVPKDHILPFLDFGRKLSTGSTPSGVNSIESSSTPRGEHPTTRDEDEDVFHEDMDVTVMKKAVERNTVPRGPIQMKPHVVGFFRRNTTELSLVNETIALETKNITNDVQNKTDIKDVHFDLQSNESGIKPHAVLSPNYGLRLNRTEKPLLNNTEDSTEESHPNTSSEIQNSTASNSHSMSETNRTAEVLDKALEVLDKTPEKLEKSSELLENSSIPILAELKEPLEEPKTNDSIIVVNENTNNTKPIEESAPVPAPKPTARILSTAVVTSVSVKETLPRLPRIKTNLTRPESYQRLTLKNITDIGNSTPLHYPESRIRTDNYTLIGLQNIRRKMYTTLRPKTTTYRPVTFRSVLRRNLTGFGSGVVHILSTPPTYIEVPKILTNTPIKQISSEQSLPSVISISTEPTTTYVNATPTMEHSSSIMISTLQQNQPANHKIASAATSVSTTHSTTSTTTTTTTSTTTTTTTEMPTTKSPLTSSTTAPTTTTNSRPFPTVLINNSTLTDLHLTDNVNQLTNTELPDDITYPPDNGTVEIEFKPLDIHSISTTEGSNKNITTRTHFLWKYNQRNQSVLRSQPVGVAYSDHFSLFTYILAGLALIPLILGLSVLARQIFKKSKKKVLDESEYSSEYNRTPLPTKLPRVPAHINWEGEKTTNQTLQIPPVVPVTKWEFSRDKLRLQTVLGQGNFGQVWKAEADDLSGHEGSTRLVAVKTVKEGASLREKEDLLRELGIMQELGAHPNVVTLLGCCTEKEPYLLIMEYVMYGKLLAFLREHRTRAHYFNFSDLSSALTSRDLTFFAYCVARGMEYLVTKGIIHRDLAARNILVDHTKLCKIADFGMSRNVRDTGQIYEQRPNRGALPIRWMAPESLHLSLFTHKSDVWSFGILLWEIITLGSTPYNKMGAREVMREVREGYRLEKPKHCRSELYKVVSKCWHSDPTKRPSFTDLKQDIATLLNDEQTKGEYVDLEALTEDMCDQST